MWVYNRIFTHCFVVVCVCTRQYHHNLLITCIPERTPKQDNETPLFTAVQCDHVDIVRMLLDAGAEHFDMKGVREIMMGWDDWQVCVEGLVLYVLSGNISFSLHIFTPITTHHRVPQPSRWHMKRSQQCWSMHGVTKLRYARTYLQNHSTTFHHTSLNHTLTQHKTSQPHYSTLRQTHAPM